jgi:hypothetical protein
MQFLALGGNIIGNLMNDNFILNFFFQISSMPHALIRFVLDKEEKNEYEQPTCMHSIII